LKPWNGQILQVFSWSGWKDPLITVLWSNTTQMVITHICYINPFFW
jgi:hypothetical protein